MRWAVLAAAPLIAASYLRQASRAVVREIVKRLPNGLTSGSLPDPMPAAKPAEPSPPPLTIHGGAVPSGFPGFSPAPPSPSLPPSVVLSVPSRVSKPGASTPASGTIGIPGNPTSLTEQAEDPEEKARQSEIREGLEKRFDNIKKHITDDDAFAAWEESRGNHLWTKGDGTAYKHTEEVSSAQRGLKDIIRQVKGLLGRPRLLPSEAQRLQDLLGRASRALDRTEGYLPNDQQGTEDGLGPVPRRETNFDLLLR